jgi:hypothetical protein
MECQRVGKLSEAADGSGGREKLPHASCERGGLQESFDCARSFVNERSRSSQDDEDVARSGEVMGTGRQMGYSRLCWYRKSALREILINSATIQVLLVVFVATLIRSAFGFGEALVAVPLLAFLIPLKVAAPLAVLVSITVAAIVVLQDWGKIHVRSAGWLVLSTLPGIPLGLLLLTSRNQLFVKGALGAIIALFSIYSLIGRAPFELKNDNRAWLVVCGFCAGVLGGAYGMNGPPLAIYGSMRRWSAQHFRATLQAYFLPASVVGMTGYLAAGLWTRAVTRFYLVSLPVTLLALFLGRIVNRRLSGDGFLKYVYAGLACIGVILLAQAVGAWR